MLPEAGAREEKLGEVSVPAGAPPQSPPADLVSRYEKQKQYRREWARKNKEYLKNYNREWKLRAQLDGRLNKQRAKDRYGVPPSDLMGLLARQGGLCKLCAATLEDGRHLDHIVPRSRGGKSELANYQYLCPTCNQSKGAMTTEEFLAHCKTVLLHNGLWWD